MRTETDDGRSAIMAEHDMNAKVLSRQYYDPVLRDSRNTIMDYKLDISYYCKFEGFWST